MKKFSLTGLASVVLASGMAFTGTATAALSPCIGTGFNISSAVVQNSGCQISSISNDSVASNATLTVNDEAFFTFADWQFDGKYDNIGAASGTDGSALYNFTGGAQGGSFTRNTLPIGTDDVLFIFKDGGGTTLVGYLIATSTVGGTYTSPFTSPPFNASGSGAKDISHISVYYRNDGVEDPSEEVPEPASLALVGIGLLGAAVARRRRATS